MKNFFKVFLLLCTAVNLIIFADCSKTGGEKLDEIKQAGKIVVYTDPNFPPFEFQGQNGVVGVDIEIAKAIAAEIGVDMEIIEAEFDSILMAINSKKGDIAISGMTINDERRESVDFSFPYVDSIQYLILLSDSDISVMEDLAGKRVGVALGYTGQFIMEDETAEGVLAGKETVITEYNSAMEAALDMQNGRIDAVVMDELVAKTIAGSDESLKAAELKYANGSIATEQYGVVIPKGNKDLCDLIDKVVKRLVDEGKIEEWIKQFEQ